MRTILGIDPGISILGFGVMRSEGRALTLIDYGCLTLRSTDSIQNRLKQIHDVLLEKIRLWNIQEVALEVPFLGKNAQNFLKLGYVRGIIYLLAAQHDLRIHEFAPREIKLKITGFGGAQKDQVARVVMQLFPGLSWPQRFDMTDAIAVTLCGVWK